jgi:threonine dehydrogenase-like Zn-dependent dehydrogenase
MGAERIIAIETQPERIAMARTAGATDIIDFAEEDVYERIKDISKGEGADGVIDCVGMEASAGHGQRGIVSAVKEKIAPSKPTYVLDQAIKAVLPCGIVSVPGVKAAKRTSSVTLSAHEADRGEKGRHHLPYHPSQHQPRGRARPLQDFQGKERRLRKGCVPSGRLSDR